MFRHKVTSSQLNSAILIPVDQYTKPPGTMQCARAAINILTAKTLLMASGVGS